MSSPDFQQNYFQLFDLPLQFAVDLAQLGARYRQLQGELHPDRYASAPDYEQRVAVQYSALVNEAYATLRKPLPRALYLLQLAGMSQEEISSQQIDGGFLIEQVELREKLESLPGLVDRETVLEHLQTELAGDIKLHQGIVFDKLRMPDGVFPLNMSGIHLVQEHVHLAQGPGAAVHFLTV